MSGSRNLGAELPLSRIRGMIAESHCIRRALRTLGHQEWVRFGVRDRIIRRLINPDTIHSYEFSVNFFGLQYEGNFNQYIDWCVYFYGAYEKPELTLIDEVLKGKENAICLDVGANVGHHSLFFSRRCQKVHAFEPYDKVRMQMEKKITRNKLRNIAIHAVGLGRENTRLPFCEPVGANTGTGSFLFSQVKGNRRKCTELQVVNGDEYCADLNLGRLDLIKIDVEGFEKEVLVGLRETIKQYRPVILMEFSAETQRSFESSKEFFSILPSDYRIWCVESCSPCCFFFNRVLYQLREFEFFESQGNLLIEPGKKAST